MMNRQRTKRSRYMEWAKLHSTARFSLATSGITSVTTAEFPRQDEQIEINAPGTYGYEPLQERLARHTGAPAECIVAATGTSMANHLAMAAVLEPGDEVLIEHPAYGPLLDVADYLGANVKRITRSSANGFALDPDELERTTTAATRLIVLTNLHNPSGALLDEGTLRSLAEIALRQGAHVLVDEVYLEMLFEKQAPWSFPIGAQLSDGADNPFIVTSSLTKGYGLSGLRCGWILAPAKIARRIWRLNDLFGANAAHAAERLSVVAFDHLARFRERTRKLLAANRALLDAFLDSRDDLETFRPVGGTVVFPRLRTGNAEAFVALLRQKYETSVVPGEFFELPQHFRIGIGGDTAELREGLERFAAALDEVARSRLNAIHFPLPHCG